MSLTEGCNNSFNTVEEYLLVCVLSWRLHFDTPSDLIQLIIQKIQQEALLDSKAISLLDTQATLIIDTLLLGIVRQLKLK